MATKLYDARLTVFCVNCDKPVFTVPMAPDGSILKRNRAAMERAVDKHRRTAGSHALRGQINAEV